MNKVLQILMTVMVTVATSAVYAAGNAASGEKLVGSCAACHGEDGNSAAPSFPKLAGLGEKYLLKQLKDIKAGDRPIVEMTGLLDAYSEQQMADIAAFYASKTTQLSGAKPLELTVNSGATVDGLKLGEKIYRAGNMETKVPACTGCHSPRGLGNEPSAYPRISGQHAEYLEKQLNAFRTGQRTNDPENVMRQVAEHMSDAEIKAVSNFAAGLN